MTARLLDIPTNDRFADISAEHQILFRVMREIDAMDCRDGLRMKELAGDTMRQILETRSDAKVKQGVKP